MAEVDFTREEVKQIEEKGMTPEKVLFQVETFKKGFSYVKLQRPCTVGDGITVLSKGDLPRLEETFSEAALSGRTMKFVPASGAASRMFKSLLSVNDRYEQINAEEISAGIDEDVPDHAFFLKFIKGLTKFAFYGDLKSAMSGDGLDIETLISRGQYKEVLEYVLTAKGLNLANIPKGLIKFHSYPGSSRTAFEEHLVEAASYVPDQNRECFLHFTVSPEHMESFRKVLERVQPVYEKRYQVSFHVTFSVQKESTDTLAVDLKNNPFRQKDGTILFRPGGHGALIENLNDLKGNIIFTKNIDNVVPDRLKPDTFKWKKILGGYLMDIQTRTFGYLEKLSSGFCDDFLLDEIMVFVRDKLCLTAPSVLKDEAIEAKRLFLMERLNRPIRVCGMVRNVGEPGGGPFWVQDQTGESSLQIVETAQIDPESTDQQDILSASTHFNPVDLVCAVRDLRGRPFDLRKYVDPNAVFISQKSKDGKDLKALEHPGLWNGAMSRWITLFIEVPIITFNPVKTVNDLLRKEHQPVRDKK